MRRTPILLGVLLLVGCGSSRTAPASPRATATQRPPVFHRAATATPIPASSFTAMLSGRVVDAATGAPLHLALLVVGSGLKMARTDARGSYSVRFPAGPAVPIFVTQTGYAEALAMGALRPHQKLTLNFRLHRIVPGTPPVPGAPITFGHT
ncbi:MAG TPA: carboxypeptidase-like regulatory domain-containing protein [Chloroflexota bacterium]|nr:carboxypeptidase-like regulatory domain-containing protein [Chloroflexota bacterium]